MCANGTEPDTITRLYNTHKGPVLTDGLQCVNISGRSSWMKPNNYDLHLLNQLWD